MNLVSLSEADLAEIETLFNNFHQEYACFFETQTRSVAKPACDYLHAQLFTKQRQNLTQYCREVPSSDYEAMQHFISDSPWDSQGPLKQLRKDAMTLLGDKTDGALIVDESGIEKQGKMSVGVQRQYCGRLGKVENCQVGVYLAYSNCNHTSLIDYRLYLPSSWASDKERRAKCGVPDARCYRRKSVEAFRAEITFQTKAELGLEMIRAFKAEGHQFGWVSMDSHYGEQPWLLKQLTDENFLYMADIPCDTCVFTEKPDTEIPSAVLSPPQRRSLPRLRQGNRGRHPTKPRLVAGSPKPIQVRDFAPNLSWSQLSVRKTERGWLIADFAAVRVWHSVDNLPFQEVWLVMRRTIGDNTTIRYSFSNAPSDTSLLRLAQMQCRRYWVERALEDAKGEAGLDQYQVRGWKGWHHHMTMTLLAMFFLLQLTLHFGSKAPLLTIQDAREILETFLPRKSYSRREFLALLEEKHRARLSARKSHAKKQKKKIEY
ncbi:MAG: IS701 family transposase [Deltaproteobacteria bacterium]|nr:IS701 family transposase [Deltaproteobacteria bacterium]